MTIKKVYIGTDLEGVAGVVSFTEQGYADGKYYEQAKRLLTAETVVEYQLYAQALIPEQFLAVAAYANGTYHYIPTAKIFDQGGYEPDFGAICTREVEPRYQKAIAEVLRPLQ